GALQLDPNECRHQGAGVLLGRVIESEAVESLALSGALVSLLAVVELTMAAVVLAAGAGGLAHAALLAGWLLLTLAFGWRYWRRRQGWTTARLEMTHDLVERMIGHRTRMLQEVASRWHDGDDRLLERYLARSRELDREEARLKSLVPR